MFPLKDHNCPALAFFLHHRMSLFNSKELVQVGADFLTSIGSKVSCRWVVVNVNFLGFRVWEHFQLKSDPQIHRKPMSFLYKNLLTQTRTLKNSIFCAGFIFPSLQRIEPFKNSKSYIDEGIVFGHECATFPLPCEAPTVDGSNPAITTWDGAKTL